MLAIMFLLAAFGFAFVVGYSHLSRPIRGLINPWGTTKGTGHFVASRDLLLKLMECPACLGFWIGMAGWFTPMSVTFQIAALPWWIGAPFLGLITLTTNLVLSAITGLLEH